MDIAALSMSMAQQNVQTQVSLSMVKQTMEQAEVSAAALIEGMSAGTTVQAPPSSNLLDVRA